jgi:hypothetical protein
MREQEVRELYEAYLQVHQPQEEVEQLDELAPATPRNRQRAVNRRQRQFDRTPMSNSTGGSGEERAALSRLTRAERLSAAASERRKVDENYDAFDVILEHLVAEGYADTNEAALAIMANMSEEWRESILIDEGLFGGGGRVSGIEARDKLNQIKGPNLKGPQGVKGDTTLPTPNPLVPLASKSKPNNSQTA